MQIVPDAGLMDHVYDILKIVGPFILGIIAQLVIGRLRLFERRVEHMEVETEQIKDNYLSRFETVNKNIACVKEEIVSKINDLRVDLARYNTKPLRRNK
jgi:hypothetical protein